MDAYEGGEILFPTSLLLDSCACREEREGERSSNQFLFALGLRRRDGNGDGASNGGRRRQCYSPAQRRWVSMMKPRNDDAMLGSASDAERVAADEDAFREYPAAGAIGASGGLWSCNNAALARWGLR
eukprot:TRINITY_DN1557_c1_g1_i1.p1 TRINITY_DN1557_c1_g1~~TRINITY_DN1557_c1_g1_i1.p1  ORF type:complete len:127 (-),score=33.14 TRINITY_DN1557_c1_g1_i1:758-1138(-)